MSQCRWLCELRMSHDGENCFRMSLSQSEHHLLEFINLDSSLQELVSEHHSVKRDIHVVATSRRTQMNCNVRSTVACQTAFDIKDFFFQAEDGIRDLTVLEFRRVLFR